MAEKQDDKLAIVSTEITVAVVALLIALALFETFIDSVLQWYLELVARIYSGDWESVRSTLAIMFSIINAALILFIAWVLWRRHQLEQHTTRHGTTAEISAVSPKEEVKESWEHIRALANSAHPSDWNMAIIRADALLDDALMHLGYEGETIAERLKIVDPTKLKSIDRVWSAHNVRNMIAHDPNAQHTKETIMHTLRSYEKALLELGMLEKNK